LITRVLPDWIFVIGVILVLQTVSATLVAGLGATWNHDGVILFSPTSTSPLYRVPASGGSAVEATRLDRLRQTLHFVPSALPDGRHFLFYSDGTPEAMGIYVGSMDSTETRRLFDADSSETGSHGSGPTDGSIRRGRDPGCHLGRDNHARSF
jgi:Tol biopolymer transport system component